MIPITGGTLENGDGLLLEGDTLYVVQNFNNQIAVVELEESEYGQMGGHIERLITHPSLRVPTTIASFGNKLYVVNAKFDIAPPPIPGNPPADPSVPFELIRIDKVDRAK